MVINEERLWRITVEACVIRSLVGFKLSVEICFDWGDSRLRFSSEVIVVV